MSLWKIVGSTRTGLLKYNNFITKAKRSTWAWTTEKAFGKYLWITNTICGGVLMAAGDLIQQEIEYIQHGRHAVGFDWTRNSRMLYVGTIQGPVLHIFYKVLDSRFPGTKFLTIAKKIFFDQTMASPFCITVFFFGMNYLNGKDMAAAREELEEKFLTVYAADCMFWIPSQFINFYWLTPKYRVMYVNIVTMCYNIFLSYMKHKE